MPENNSSLMGSLGRATAIWFIIIFAETLHGIARRIFLEPRVGDLRARQISVFTGSLIIFCIAIVFIRWLKSRKATSCLVVGGVWVVLTIAFEVLLGRLVMGVSWERIYSDYDVSNGGLMVFGILAMFFSPIAAARLRG